jgi:hypothetical protein
VASFTITMTGRGVAVATVQIGAQPSPESVASEIMAFQVETGYSLLEIMRLMSAALLGKVDISGSTHTFRSADDSVDRITATVDGAGQRTAITLDGS